MIVLDQHPSVRNPMNKSTIVAALISLAACTAPTPALTLPPPALTSPTPAPASIPTSTPTSAPTSLTSTPSSRCLSSNDADAHIGQVTCVSGVVVSTYKDPNSSAFFIDFETARTGFYGVSFRYTWDNLRGQCVVIRGRIERFRGRPQIVIADRSQLSFC